MLVYFFLGALCRAFITFGLRCHVRIFLWDIYFENHGLGLGLALFRLGTRVGLFDTGGKILSYLYLFLLFRFYFS